MKEYKDNTEIIIETGINEEEIELDISEPFNPSEIHILSKSDSMHNIIQRLKHDEIDMNTDFQRHADLWNNHKMSRLIESILIRLPLPPFYFDASDDDRWLIVDGLQRLSAIKKFVIDEKLRLRGLEYLADLESKKYSELPRLYKRRIDECSVTLFLIQPGTPDKVKYSIFRRINTGGLILNDQEIRNAMTSPRIRAFLRTLAKNECLITTIGDQSRRMVDQEMILRYLAFRYMDYEQTGTNITTFLDDMIKRLEESSDTELQNYRTVFEETICLCRDIFGERAFEKPSDESSRKRRKNATLFETIMCAFSELTPQDKQKLLARKEIFLQKYRELFNDTSFFESITYSTQKKEHYRIRRDKIKKLIQEVLND